MGDIIPINRTYAPLQAFVDELARCGMRHAVTCPGSRNAPLALTLAAESRIDAVSVIDERSAGFVALGLAKATGRPVAITTTSGTAAANLLPAVAEAWESRVPLIVLTADRPPELREVGAGQAIDQIKIYGAFVKWFTEVGNHEPGRNTAIHHRSLACRAWAGACGQRPGPVHLNFPLREPLAPLPEDGLAAADWAGRPGDRPWVEVREPAPDAEAAAEALVHEIGGIERGVIVCGPTREAAAVPVALLAAALGWPVLAEPTSGLRCGHHDRTRVVSHYDVLLRDEQWAAAHLPEVVLRVGDTPTSKPLRTWLGRTRQIVLDPHLAWHEPTRMAETLIAAPATSTCDALAERLGAAANGDWVREWRQADALVPPALGAAADPFEPKVYAALAEAVPDGTTLWVSSSMPIRDVEAYFPSSDRSIRFLANRGANGIDGVVSSALGAAIAAGDDPTVLLTGDLALIHDAGGVLAAARTDAELAIVCVNNGGGGIFDMLPVAEHADRELYEEHVATPAATDISELADLGGFKHATASTPDEVRSALAPRTVVEVRTERATALRQRRELVQAVAEGL